MSAMEIYHQLRGCWRFRFLPAGRQLAAV